MSRDMVSWIALSVVVLTMLALDLGVFNRHAHVIKVKEALGWSAMWIGLSLAFNAAVWAWLGPEAGSQFFAGYLLEKSLSVDNIFIFLLIFTYFRVPPQYQHRILYWGILGALVMRAVLIGLGVTLLHHVHGVIYAFGALLLFTSWRMLRAHESDLAPQHNPVVRLVQRVVAVTPDASSGRLFVRQDGRWLATPFFVALVALESADLVFAVDSIPAVFGVSDDPFIVYSSNIFAVLGLRSLYFALAGSMDRFQYFRYGLGAVLAFVGLKMLLSGVLPIPIGVALAVIAGCIGASVAYSLWKCPLPRD